MCFPLARFRSIFFPVNRIIAKEQPLAEIVNLRMARKARERDTAARKAAENRALHGRTLGERTVAEREAARLAATVDGARREKD